MGLRDGARLNIRVGLVGLVEVRAVLHACVDGSAPISSRERRRPWDGRGMVHGIFGCGWRGRDIRTDIFGYTEGMSKRLVDIDDELLQEASAILEARTMKETVNRALESVVLVARRRSHAERLEVMRGLDLDDPKVMAGAWR